MSVTFNCCAEFKISDFACYCIRRNRKDKKEITFDLIHSEPKKYDNLIPANEDYIYFKILNNNKIISFEGENFKEMPLKKNDVIGKKIEEIKKYPDFFMDYLLPLFISSVKEKEAYQIYFSTSINSRMLTCNIYPCSIPGIVSSCDVVIRYAHHVFSNDTLKGFRLENTTPVGEVIELLY